MTSLGNAPRGRSRNVVIDRILAGRRVLTTGDVAALFDCAPRTAKHWIDTGMLRGFKLPGSKDRRVNVPDALDFMLAAGVPWPVTRPAVAVHLHVPGRCGVRVVPPVEAGALAGRREISAAVVGSGDGLAAAVALCRDLRAIDPNLRLAVVLGADRGVGGVPKGTCDAVFADAETAATWAGGAAWRA